MGKRGQSNLPVIIFSILIIIVLILLSFILIKYFKYNEDDKRNLENITRIDQLDDAIIHNLSLTNTQPDCNDECSARGLRKCFGEGYEICGNFDSDSCYEWSPVTDCDNNEECFSGRCRNPPTNDNSLTDSSITRYDFDEIELLSVEQFNVSRVGNGPDTWADTILSNINNLEISHATFNLKKDGQIIIDEEEYIKVKGNSGEKKYLYNSGGPHYSKEEVVGYYRQFWSAKQIIGDDLVKDKTPPVYSVTLLTNIDEENNLLSAKLAFSDNGLDLENRDKYFDWSTTNQTQNKIQNQTFLEIECLEGEKSGLCGPANKIYPLDNNIDGDIINVYSPGIIFEDDNFKLSLEGSEKFIQFQNHQLKLIIQNKKSVNNIFDYNYIFNSQNCNDLYDSQHSSFENLPESILVQEGKDEFYRITFTPLETKEFIMTLKPNSPIITIDESTNYLNFYYRRTMGEYYTLFFGGLIRPGTESETITKEGETITILRGPEITSCGEDNFPKAFSLSCIAEVGFTEYGYSTSKCCNNIFYPNFECCNDGDCGNRDNTDGYCVDGLCMSDVKPQNKLFGNKKILVASEFNSDDACEIINVNSISPHIIEDINKLEEYYDHSASILLNESPNFVNFNLSLVLKLPSSFVGFYDAGNREAEIINKLETMCGVNAEDFDIIILPNALTTTLAGAGFALGIGNSKVVFSASPNAPTLIHEIGHLFGCIDLYKLSGGRLQWAHTFYGEQRTDNFNSGPTNLVEQNRINELSDIHFQVCRGHLGWTDNNKNGITDVKEW